MDISGTNRLANISADNHAPWLWVVHVFSIVFVLLGVCLRVWTKWRNVALSDALWLLAHVSLKQSPDTTMLFRANVVLAAYLSWLLDNAPICPGELAGKV